MRTTRTTSTSALRPRATAAAAAAVAAAFALTSCTADPAPETTPTMEQEMPTPTEEPTEETEEMVAALVPSGTGDPFADARTAAAHMPETAATFAGGFVRALGVEGQVDSEAAELRAGLTALLQEHVYLAGIAVATAYQAGADSGEFEAAAAAVDGNSTDIADAIAALAGEEHREEFLTRWRDHVGYFVDYAVARAGGDEAGVQQAVAELDQYTTDAGAFFEEISGGELPAAAVKEDLDMHVASLAAAVDALAAGDPGAYAALQEAASHMGMSASVLAGGFTNALGLEGDPADPASELRSGLTDLLQEHVYLAAVAVFAAYTAEEGPESAEFAAAAEVLDGNSVALSEAIGSLAGEEAGAEFLEEWRSHIGFFVDYAVARAGADEEGAQQALRDLDAYRAEAGAYLEELSGGELPAEAVADGLGHHIETLAGAIDSLAEALVG